MQTPLDRAHAAMIAAPEDDAARLGFYERVADAELFVLLEAEAEGDRISPEIFPIEDGSYVLAFDRAERLATFVGQPAPYAALSGRAIAAMLAGQGLGLGLNLATAPSEMLIPPEAVAWLSETLASGPAELDARLEELRTPSGLPERLIEALSSKLALAEGMARFAWLAGTTYEGGRRGHLLAFVGTAVGAAPALARAVSEALIFSGIEAGELDVAFVEAENPLAARLAKVGLRFDIPEPPRAAVPVAPGSDPDRPPRLR